MFLDDAFQNLRSGPAIPGALWIHHRNGPALTNPQAVGLGAIYLRQTKLFHPTLKLTPPLQPPSFGAPLSLGPPPPNKNQAPHPPTTTPPSNPSNPISPLSPA